MNADIRKKQIESVLPSGSIADAAPKRRSNPAPWQFSLAALLGAVSAAAAWCALAAQAGWQIAAVAAATVALLAVLAFGWYHAARPRPKAGPRKSGHEWFYLALVVLIVAAAPLAAVIALQGMERYGHWVRIPLFWSAPESAPTWDS